MPYDIATMPPETAVLFPSLLDSAGVGVHRSTFSFQATPTHSTLTKVIVWRALRFAAIKTTQSRAFVGIQLPMPGIYILPKREFRNEFRGYRCWTRGQAASAPAGRHGSQGRPGAVPREDQGP